MTRGRRVPSEALQRYTNIVAARATASARCCGWPWRLRRRCVSRKGRCATARRRRSPAWGRAAGAVCRCRPAMGGSASSAWWRPCTKARPPRPVAGRRVTFVGPPCSNGEFCRVRPPVAAAHIGDVEQGRSHSRACGCACSTRTPSSARSPTPRFTPAQADAITNAVRLAAEHGDHVPLDQFTASLAEVRAEIAEVRTEIAAALKRPSPSRQPTPCQVHALEEAPAFGSLSSRTGSRVVVDSPSAPGRREP